MESIDDIGTSAEACYQRGVLLHSRGRPAEAAEWFRKALAADPRHALSHARLALCLAVESGREAESIEEARRAVALAPEHPFLQSILALTLIDSARDGHNAPIEEGLSHAVRATELDAENDFAWAVRGHGLLRLRRYAEAEDAALRALRLDTESRLATSVLAAALLNQGKDDRHAELVRYQLDRNPDDPASHTSAGWQALRRGRHEEANRHFLEALRLDPTAENARLGLLESYRARNPLYRVFIHFSRWMSRFSDGHQNLILIGGFVAYRILRHALARVSPFWASLVMGLWLLFALWSHLGRSLGSFLILFDRFARRCLRRKEKWEGGVVGGLVAGSFVALGASFVPAGPDPSGLRLLALALVLTAVAWAAAFTNDHFRGRHLYWWAALAAAVGCVLQLANACLPDGPDWLAAGLMMAVLTGVAVTWMRALRIWYA